MRFDVVITTALPVQSGTSKAGKPWSKQTFVGTYDGTNPQYPKQIVFDVMGDKIGQFNLQPGGRYDIEVDFSARPYNDKWYMSAQCWKAAPFAGQGHIYPRAQVPAQGYPQQPPVAQPYSGNPQNAQPVQAQPVGYPPQGAAPFCGQQASYPVNPQSTTPTLDSMGVTGYQPQQTQSAPSTEDDDLPF